MGFLQDFQYYWTNTLDPRVIDMPLIASSYQLPLITVAYLYFVLDFGPRFMKNRPPYLLNTFMKFYNIVQIVANVWLVYDIIDAGLLRQSLICSDMLDYSYNYTPMRLTKSMWYYLMLKIFDYVETGIFVLRKKRDQVSGLHLYHHVSTSVLIWLSVRYIATPHSIVSILLNSIIHVLMYTYYFLATWGQHVREAIANMKPRITQAQMVQFVILILYASQNFIPSCKIISHWLIFVYIGNLMINFYLFYKFYQAAYRKSEKEIQ